MVDASTSPIARLSDDALRAQLHQLRDHLQTTALLGGAIPDAGAEQLRALEAELQRRGLADARSRGDDGAGDSADIATDVFGLDEGSGNGK